MEKRSIKIGPSVQEIITLEQTSKTRYTVTAPGVIETDLGEKAAHSLYRTFLDIWHSMMGS